MPTIEEYRVGPLPYPRRHSLLHNPSYKDPIPWHTRSPMADHEIRMWQSFLSQELSRVEVLLRMATDG
jgi:hypothetical protein